MQYHNLVLHGWNFMVLEQRVNIPASMFIKTERLGNTIPGIQKPLPHYRFAWPTALHEQQQCPIISSNCAVIVQSGWCNKGYSPVPLILVSGFPDCWFPYVRISKQGTKHCFMVAQHELLKKFKKCSREWPWRISANADILHQIKIVWNNS